VQLHSKTASARNKIGLGLYSLIDIKVNCKERFLPHHYYFSFFFLVFRIHKQISFARLTNTGKQEHSITGVKDTGEQNAENSAKLSFVSVVSSSSTGQH